MSAIATKARRPRFAITPSYRPKMMRSRDIAPGGQPHEEQRAAHRGHAGHHEQRGPRRLSPSTSEASAY